MFKDKIVMITGGASGMGKELAKQLGAQGAVIIVADINTTAGESLIKELRLNGVSTSFQSVDMVDQEAVQQLIQSVVSTHGRLDYMINGVGIVMGGEVQDTNLSNWHKVMTNNVEGISNGMHFAYQQMVLQGHGHIINFASAAGLFPVPIMTIYGASKFAIVGLTHGLRAEAKDMGVKVSVVCPGIVKTPIYESAIYEEVDKDKAIDLFMNKLPSQETPVAVGRIIKGIQRNKATIMTWYPAYIYWWLYRLSPALYIRLNSLLMPSFRKHLRIK